MILTNKQLVDELLLIAGALSLVEKTANGYTYHKNRWGYVFGGQGELYTRELAEKWGKAKRSGKDADYFIKDAKAWYTPPRRVGDCSGIIVEVFRRFKPGYSDRTAASFKRQFVHGGTIGSIPKNVPGIGVWKTGHIGVSLGDGRVVESKGVLHGVVIGTLAATRWTHWGYFAEVEYTTATPPAPPKPKPVLTRNLKYVWYSKMRGSDVELLQRELVRRGYALGNYGKNKDGADGVFGVLTRDAVRRFQTLERITVDGIVGKQTWGRLFD